MQTHSAPHEATAVVDEPEARELIRRAFESTYRWSPDFRGFRAEVTIRDGGRILQGEAVVSLPGETTVTLPGSDQEIRKWVEGQVGMMAVHRGARTFDESDGRHRLTLGPEDHHPLGRLLLIDGDGMSSRYRILDGQIRQINRSMGPVRFTINVEDSLTTPEGRHLTTRYTVYYFQPQDGSLKQVDSVTDRHAVVDGWYLPGTRRVIGAEAGEVRVRVMEFTGHRLL